MLRRFLRIFCVVGLVVLLRTAVVSQFWMVISYLPKALKPVDLVRVDEAGISVAYWDSSHVPEIQVPRVRDWHVRNLFHAPRYRNYMDSRDIFLPWWFLLASWGLMTALIWRLTRSKVSRGFPIEPAKIPAKSE